MRKMTMDQTKQTAGSTFVGVRLVVRSRRELCGEDEKYVRATTKLTLFSILLARSLPPCSIKNAQDEGFNPFKRRPNKPQVLWSVEIEGKEEQERIKKANEEEKLKLEREEGERVEREKAALAEGGEGGGAGEGGDIVVFDVLASKKTDGVGVVGGGGSAAPRQRTGMSLTDYLAKKQ